MSDIAGKSCKNSKKGVRREYRYYKYSPIENPPGPESGTYRVMRGGSWNDYAGSMRCASRGYGEPSNHNFSVGFRLCQDN